MEPLSITAGVIAVTGLAFKSCKALKDIIKGLKNAPDTLKSLHHALETFENVAKSVQKELDGLEDAAFSPDQKDSLRALEPVLRHCNTVCDVFSARLAELTSHSHQDHIIWIDRFRLRFNDSDIQVLKENLAQCQRTLTDALSFTNLRTTTQTRVAVDELAASYALSVNDIGGRIQGLELSMQTFCVSSATAARNDVDEVLNVLREHNRILKACLRVYQPALRETSASSGTTVRYEVALDTARVMAGSIDFHGEALPVNVERAEARGQSRIFNGQMSSEASRVFWN